MAPEPLYIVCLIGAVGLYLLLRRGSRAAVAAGVMLGGGAAVWLMAQLPTLAGGPWTPEIFFVVFSLIAVASALRMITHSRPVYSALYFIMVVLASAGLFLLMQAEFMAFALVIVYAGAILVTYVFVLMLAQQAEGAEGGGQPEYDLNPREPAAAVGVGFLMLALLCGMIRGAGEIPGPSIIQARRDLWGQLEHMSTRFERRLHEIEPELELPPNEIPDSVADEYRARLLDGAPARYVRVDSDGTAWVAAPTEGSAEVRMVELPESILPDNVEQVGLALVRKFPVSLELAGVILLLAMFGAVVLARRQIELSEDEVREAAGLPRFALDDEERGATDLGSVSRPFDEGGEP